MICDYCKHSDGKYCCDGLLPYADVKLTQIPEMMEKMLKRYGAVIDWDENECECYWGSDYAKEVEYAEKSERFQETVKEHQTMFSLGSQSVGGLRHGVHNE